MTTSLRSTLEQEMGSTQGGFVGADRATLRLWETPEEMLRNIQRYIQDNLIARFPADLRLKEYEAKVLFLLESAIKKVGQGDVAQKSGGNTLSDELWELFEKLVKTKRDIFPSASASTSLFAAPPAAVPPSGTPPVHDGGAFTVKSGIEGVQVRATEPPSATSKIGQRTVASLSETGYLACMQETIAKLRSQSRAPTTTELYALHYAYTLIGSGVALPRCFRPLGLPGRRPRAQTYVALTDPGPDHLKITCQDQEILRGGVTVHTEWIDRSESQDRNLVEAYRVPSHVDVAKVRMHVADEAPCSVFIGRPPFECLGYRQGFSELAEQYSTISKDHSHSGDQNYFFEAELLKAVHETGAACTAMFMDGVAECKIAVENMTENQAIRFLKALRANVARNESTQVLSAAFNLFQPIYSESQGRKLQEPMDIARLGIKIAAEGGFDKVTWDGARSEMLTLAHEAHRAGLITYVSAGMTKETIHIPVEAGMDGVGIGVDLHYMAPDKSLGALCPSKIKEILEHRNRAQEMLMGRAARLLAYLDYKVYEGTNTSAEYQLSEALFKAMLSKNETSVGELIQHGAPLTPLNAPLPPADDVNVYDKYVSHARELLATEHPAIEALLPIGWREKLQAMLVDREPKTNEIRFFLNTHRLIRRATENVRAAVEEKSTAALTVRSTPAVLPPPFAPPRFHSELKAKALKVIDSLDTLKRYEEHRIQKAAAKTAKLAAASFTATVSKTESAGAPVTTAVSCRIKLRRCVINDGTDFSKVPDFLGVFDPSEAYIIGDVKFPPGVTEEQLIAQGAIIIKPKLATDEFDPIRTGLYTVDELRVVDDKIYQFVQKKDKTQLELLAQYIHDGLILDALKEENKGRYIVGVMGGHSMARGSEVFKEVARVSYKLAKSGFTIVTGGGPGAMESANFGAWMCDIPEPEFEKELDILTSAPDSDVEAADRMREKFITNTGKIFASKQAKFVSNAVREDILVTMCNCGILFTEGSAGTRTEIAQFAVPNCYASEKDGDVSKPMIFFKNFWIENTVFQSLLTVSEREDLIGKSKGYSKRIYCVSDVDSVVGIVQRYRDVVLQQPTAAVGTPQLAQPMAFTTSHSTTEQQEERAKMEAARAAVQEWVTRDGMVIGVGSGTTVKYVIEELKKLVDTGKVRNITCVPSSLETRDSLLHAKLNVSDLKHSPKVDVDIDGADRCDLYLNVVKGGGGCLLQEKVLAASASVFIIVAHWQKDCETLAGVRVPIEVTPLAVERVILALRQRYGPSTDPQLRVGKPSSDNPGIPIPYATDNANFIIDALFDEKQMIHPGLLEEEIQSIPGVVEVGLFTKGITMAYFGKKNFNPKTEKGFYTRDRTTLTLNPSVTAKEQSDAFKAVFDRIKEVVKTGVVPVVELDLDLTSLIPYERTVNALRQAGRDWDIEEFKTDPQRYTGGILPGYAYEAWQGFVAQIPFIVSKYPHLKWTPPSATEYKWLPRTDPNATVWSSFHIAFWGALNLMANDIPTTGLLNFINQVEKLGGVVVYISGRWLDVQLAPTVYALREIRSTEADRLLFGNPDLAHVSDEQNKANKQPEIKVRFGLPVAVFDDRAHNLKAVNEACGNSLICVQMAIPGFSCAPNIAEARYKASTFEYEQAEAPILPVITLDHHDIACSLPLLPFATQVREVPLGAPHRRSGRAKPAKPVVKPVEEPAEDEEVQEGDEGDVCVRVCTFNCENLFKRFNFKKKDEAEIRKKLEGGWTISDTALSIFDEPEKRLTANCIREVNADILALEEVEDLVLLDMFNKSYLGSMYPHRLLIQGNDQRYINVGLLSKYPLGVIRTHRDELKPKSDTPLFSRDCLEVEVKVGSKQLHVLVNHFKSMMGGRDETRGTRILQVNKVVEILNERSGVSLIIITITWLTHLNPKQDMAQR
ncbi:ribose 5-phosphate isomerase, type A [Pelomyxa schiedti]|nr:ribose 5-phosphate isomerase, type A [Pelomyxa schiedti]